MDFTRGNMDDVHDSSNQMMDVARENGDVTCQTCALKKKNMVDCANLWPVYGEKWLEMVISMVKCRTLPNVWRFLMGT